MTEWCLYGEAIGIQGDVHTMAPETVIVNVPDDVVLAKQRLVRLTKGRITKRGLEILTRKVVDPKYWGTRNFYSRWGKLMTRITIC